MKALKQFWEGWKKFGQMMGDFIARIFLSVFYFTIVLPFGLGARFQGDALGLKAEEGTSNWQSRSTKDATVDNARKQY